MTSNLSVKTISIVLYSVGRYNGPINCLTAAIFLFLLAKGPCHLTLLELCWLCFVKWNNDRLFHSEKLLFSQPCPKQPVAEATYETQLSANAAIA